MEAEDILAMRLWNTGISSGGSNAPEEAVSGMCSLQAQDYRASLWAMGMRCGNGTTVSDVEGAIANGKIVRTWLNRGTIHFTSRNDVRWLQELFSPGLRRTAELRDEHLGLTQETISRVKEIFSEQLSTGGISTRSSIYDALEEKGMSVRKNNLGYHLLYRAAWDGLICFGPQIGNEQTFVLMDKWVGKTAEKSREESLQAIAEGYFRSHGPATLHDFAWWSGLRMPEARKGLELASPSLDSCEVLGIPNYFVKGTQGGELPEAVLLPAFDEYVVGYRDRSMIFTLGRQSDAIRSNGIFLPSIVIGGSVVGTWKATRRKSSISMQTVLFRELNKNEKNSLREAASHYGDFQETEAEIRL